MLVSLNKNQVDYIGKSSSQTNSLRGQNGNISWSLFNKKSPLDRNKSHLCACMFPNWYFESTAAFVSWYDQAFLLPQTCLTPCTFPLTIQSCLSRWTTKEPFLFRAQPMIAWRGTELFTYPSKGTKCHREITLEFLTPSWQNIPVKRNKNENSVQSSLSPMSKMAGQLIHHLNVKPRLIIVFATKAFCFTMQRS